MNPPRPSSPEQEEFVPTDDAIIGKAVRWSILIVVIVTAAGIGLAAVLKHKPKALAPKVSLITAPASPHRPRAEIPLAKFTDVTREAGITFSHVNGAYGEKLLPETMGGGVAFIDFDNDGAPDLLFVNSTYWPWHVPEGKPPPTAVLYHNDGNGHFTDVSARSGIQIKNPATGVPAAKTLGVAPIDLDGDGWIDLVVANDTTPNHVFMNQHDGTFKEIGAGSGIAFDNYGNTRGAMGIDAARYRNDEQIGIGIANFANEMTALYVAQNKPLLFADESIPEGVGPESRRWLKFGLFFFDYDLDGRLDLLTANGHLEEEITKIQKSQTYAQPAQLFWNAGERAGGCFVAVPRAKAGPDLFKPIVGRGSAFADIDGDGDLDVVLTQ